MSPDDRRAHIVEATVPLLLAHGAGVTTKQIAEAAGVAEGTVFRVFDDKQALVDAAIAKYLDPQPLRDQLAGIDRSLPLEFKVRQVISMLQQRFAGVFAMMAAVGMRERPPVTADAGRGYGEVLAELFAPDVARLGVPVERIAPLLRLLAFVTSIEPFHASNPVELDELVEFALYGIAGKKD